MLVDQELPLEGEVVEPGEWTPREAAEYVIESYAKSVLAIIETGRRLDEAKAKVGHGNWLPLVSLLPFSERTAQRYMAIARHPDLSNTTHVSDLPASWGTLYVLAQLPAGEIPKRIEAGEITPELDRATAQQWVSIYGAARQEALNAWSQANDGLLHALSYAKTYRPPDDTDGYPSVAQFRKRVADLAAIIESWEDA